MSSTAHDSGAHRTVLLAIHSKLNGMLFVTREGSESGVSGKTKVHQLNAPSSPFVDVVIVLRYDTDGDLGLRAM